MPALRSATCGPSTRPGADHVRSCRLLQTAPPLSTAQHTRTAPRCGTPRCGMQARFPSRWQQAVQQCRQQGLQQQPVAMEVDQPSHQAPQPPPAAPAFQPPPGGFVHLLQGSQSQLHGPGGTSQPPQQPPSMAWTLDTAPAAPRPPLTASERRPAWESLTPISEVYARAYAEEVARLQRQRVQQQLQQQLQYMQRRQEQQQQQLCALLLTGQGMSARRPPAGVLSRGGGCVQ